MLQHPKLEVLRSALAKIAPNKKLTIAFSGGLDSRFLAFASNFLGFKAHLFHVSGPHITAEETSNAKKWAEKHGFSITVVNLNPLEQKEVSYNSHERCYWCKKRLFQELLKIAESPLCDGTNHSDLSQYRPGLKALQELGIHSPLADCQISKPEIRNIGRNIGLDNVDQPSRPCILTRFPYDQLIVDQEMNAVGKAETAIWDYLNKNHLSPLAFRLRKTAPSAFTLHILERDFENLSDIHRQKLLELVKSIDGNFSSVTIAPQVNLSGYFDQNQRDCRLPRDTK